MKGHWSHTCCTSKHLVDLYQVSIKTNVLKTGPDRPVRLSTGRSDRRPVTIPVRSGHLARKEVEPELNRLNRRSDRRTGRTGWFPPNRPTQSFFFFFLPASAWLFPCSPVTGASSLWQQPPRVGKPFPETLQSPVAGHSTPPPPRLFPLSPAVFEISKKFGDISQKSWS